MTMTSKGWSKSVIRPCPVVTVAGVMLPKETCFASVFFATATYALLYLGLFC